MEVVRAGALVASTITVGLVAGVLGIYANAIMPGLGRTDDRTLVGAFQSIDRAIVNPLFMSVFFGALLLTGLAAAVHLGAEERSRLPWIAAALVLYLVAITITIAINVPLNDELEAAGTPDRIRDLAAVRAQFDEARWNAWNIVRAVTTTAAFGSLTWALVLLGRAGGKVDRPGPSSDIP